MMQNATPSLRDRQREATAREILTAAEIVLAERGIGAASMAAIAQAAGVAVGTLYNHFADKDVLIETLVTTRHDEFWERIDQALAENAGLGFEARLHAAVSMILGEFDSRRRYLRIVFDTENAVPKPKNKKQPQPSRSVLGDRLHPIIEAGLAEGVLEPHAADLYGSSLAGMMRGVLLKYLDDDTVSFASATDKLFHLFLNGARKTP